MLSTFQKAVLAILGIGVVAIALVVAAKAPALAATPTIVGSGGTLALVSQGAGGPPPGIVVVGEAKLSYRPDIAYLTLGAVEQAATAEAAQAQLATRLAKVFERAKSLGIGDGDVANGTYNIQPQYVYKAATPPRISGYQATQQVVVTLRDVKAVGRVLDAIVRDDGATTASIRFALGAGKDPELDARSRAIQDARDKADAMAKAAGVRLGSAISVSEISAPQRDMDAAYKVVGPVAAPATQIPTGDVELTVRMQVQFAIAGS